MCNFEIIKQDRYIATANWTEQRANNQMMNFYWWLLKTRGEITRNIEIDNAISTDQIIDCARLIRNHWRENDVFIDWNFNFDYLENVVNENTGDQKIAKHIAKKIKQDFNYKLPDDIKAKIGDLMRVEKTKRTIQVKITKGCDGDAHEYYHESSCYWGGYASSRDYIESSNGGAVRLYENDRIVGRAWYVPYNGDDITNGLVMFNFYGKDHLSKCDVFGSLVAQALNISGQRTLVSLDYNGSGSFYQNSDTTFFAGVVNAPSINRYRLYITLDEPKHYVYGNADREWCDYCNEYYHEDDMYYIDEIGEHVCESCRDYYFTYVDSGDYRGEYHASDNVVSIGYDTYHIEDSSIAEVYGEYYHIDDLVCDEYGDYHVSDSDSWCQLESGEIYPSDDCIFNEETEQWELNND